MQHPSLVTRTIEPNVTIFSASEVRVVLLPVGEAPEEVFQRYASLIVRHRQVELNNVRSFYKEAQKSPFKFFPWKTGNMHFKFLPEDIALQTSPLNPLHNHRRVLGVVGIMHCPHVKDINKAYMQFEQRCKAFPDAFTLRCFAFAPSDEQVSEDRKKHPNFIMFPPGDTEQLDNHAEVVMHDFAACLLAELERWMLTASPAMVDLNTYMDSAEFTGVTALEAVQNRLATDEELKTKRKYGRLRKAMGDYCLLAGTPQDAQDHYSTAADLARVSADWIWLGAALGGYGAAKVLEAAIANGAFAINKSSVFNDEGQWRARASRAKEGQEEEGQDSLSETSRSSSAFGGAQFWAVLRASGVEGELRALMVEGKGATRRRGALPLLVEADLKLARFMAGLHGHHARREVSELVSGLQGAVEGLHLPMDRLQTFVEGAQVLGLVGSGRKRTLMIWQAVELSKMLGFPDSRTLEVARKALEPADDPSDPDSEEDVWNRRRPLAAGGVPRSWGMVRAGCLEAILGLAIFSKAHADVWDCAATLLREHTADLSAHRQQSLLENLLAAASQMAPQDRNRPGPGPPPLLYFSKPRGLPPALRPLRFTVVEPSAGSPLTPGGPFLYDPFSAKRQAAAKGAAQEVSAGPQWVCGELASVDIEVHNPAMVGVRIDKMVLEAEYLGDPSMAPREYMTLTSSAHPQPAWKPKPVSLNIPANTRPVRIQLEGTPLLKGMLVLTGCRLTAFGGVTWFQPWSKKPTSVQHALAQAYTVGGGPDNALGGRPGSAASAGPAATAGLVEHLALPDTRITVAPALPRARLALAPVTAQQCLNSPDSGALGLVLPPAPPPGTQQAQQGAAVPALHLLQGQMYRTELRVSNTGKLPIEEATISVVLPVKGAQRVSIQLDHEALSRALPLDPGETAVVPVSFAATVRSAHSGEEVVREEVQLEYLGPSPGKHRQSAGGKGSYLDGAIAGKRDEDGGEEAASPSLTHHLGRRCTLVVEVHVQPSLQVSQVQFRDVYLPSPTPSTNGVHGSEGPDGTPEAYRQMAVVKEGGEERQTGGTTPVAALRRCVMEVGVVNRGRWPLQVWAADMLPSPHFLGEAPEALVPPADPAPGIPASLLLAPGRRGTLCCLLPQPAPPQAQPSTDPLPSTAADTGRTGVGGAHTASAPPAGSRKGVMGQEELERTTCAQALAEVVGLRFRVDAEEAEEQEGGMVGVAPLVQGEVYNGLTPAALALLRPPALTFSITPTPLPPPGDTQLGGSSGGPGGSSAPGAQQAQQGSSWEWLQPDPNGTGAAGGGGGEEVREAAVHHGGMGMAATAGAQHAQQQPACGGYQWYPGVRCLVGQPLQLTLHARRTGPSGDSLQSAAGGGQEEGVLRVETCFACCPVLPSGVAGEGGLGLEAGATAAAWTGQVSGVQLELDAGGTATHHAGICLLTPGLYQITLRQVLCHRGNAAQQAAGRSSTLVGVEPCYVLAESGVGGM